MAIEHGRRRAVLLGAGSAVGLAAGGAAAWLAATGSMADYRAHGQRLRGPLVPPDIRGVLRYATLAANSHNTQPWRFRAGAGVIDLLPDFARRTPVVDPGDHHLFVSLGCAAENLGIAAAATGRPGEFAWDGEGIRYRFSSGPVRAEPLLAAITRRQSTRAMYDGRQVGAADLAALERAAAVPGVRLVLLTERAAVARVGDLVVTGNSAQMADRAFMRELKLWLRFNPRAALAAGDGLFSAASGSPALPDAVARLAFGRFFTAEAESAKYARQLASSAGVAIFVGEREDREHWVRVGRACQRFALEATARGLKHAFINQPVEVAGLRAELAALAGEPGKRPDIAMRFGYGPDMPYSTRRPVDAVMV